MMPAVTYTIATMAFGLLLLLVSNILSNRFNSSRNKNTPFECGFEPKDSARLPFSMRFFILAVIFLIFDIEIALLFPTILGLKMEVFKQTFMAGFVFLVILLVGILHEWNQGSLSWVA